jgi:glycosyltransferase involved in cell wall biosynthesis
VRFKVVITGWNCARFVNRCLNSVARQTDSAFDVCVVDDASDGPEQAAIMRTACAAHGWRFIGNRRRRGALRNQYEAVHVLDPAPEDVVVFVDADDRLAHDDVLRRLRSYYECYEPLMTYGSYRCDPSDHEVTPAMNFPVDVVAANGYRRFSARDDPDAIWFNHLRTVTFGLFERLRPAEDFTFPDGSWLMACCDTAVMVPCLELAAGRHLLIPEVLYVYTRNNPMSDCRIGQHEIERAHHRIFHEMRPKDPLAFITAPAAVPDAGVSDL